MKKMNWINRIVIFIVFIFGFFLSLRATNTNASAEVISRGNDVTQDSFVPESYHKYAISFRTSDGVKLIGYVLGTGTKGVTLGHANGWTLKSLVPFANELVERGYRVIIWDYRNNPPSDVVSEGAINDRQDLDVMAAVDVLRSEGVTHFFMVGASIGGTSTILAAAQNRELVGLGILSSPRGIGSAIFAGDVIKQITVPSFFAVSTNDSTGDYFTEVKALYDNSGAKDKVFHTIASGEHGFDMLLTPQKYLNGLEPETPYSETKNPDPLRMLNQQLLDFIDKSFNKISSSTKKTSSSSSQPHIKTEYMASKTGPIFLLILLILLVVGSFLIGVIVIIFFSKKGSKK